MAPLELEGLGDDADGQNAGLTGQVSDDGSSAGAGAAAHTGGDEDHVGVLEDLGDGSPGLLGRLLADVGLGTGTHAAGQLLADLQLVGAGGLVQVLLVGIDDDEVNAVDLGLQHTIDNIVAGAADANDLDLNNAICKQFRHNEYPPMYIGVGPMGHYLHCY